MFKKILWFVSGFCTILFFVPAFSYAWAVLLAGAFVLLWLSYTHTSDGALGFTRKLWPNVLALLFLAGCVMVFMNRWQSRFSKEECLAASIGLGVLASYFVFTTTARLFSKSWNEYLPNARNKQRLSLRSDLYLLLCSVGLLAICSSCSWLYQVNPAVSANTFMTGGRGMLAGFHLYEDLHGSAGPIPYLFSALSWKLYENFTGVFILEVVLDLFFFVYLARMVNLYFDVNVLILAFPVLAGITLISPAFGNGDTSEEFCLLFLAICLYLSLSSIRARRILGLLQFLTAGLCMGLVFWTKVQLMGFFAGWIVIQWTWMISRRRFDRLLAGTLCLVLGAALASAPIVYYFKATNTLDAFLQGYLIEPMIWNGWNGDSLMQAARLFWDGISKTILQSPLLWMQMMASLMAALRLGSRLFGQMVVCLLCTLIFQYGFFAWTPSSGLIWNVFGAFSLVLYYKFYQSMELTYFYQMPIRILGLLTVVIAAWFCSGSSYFMERKTEDFAQIQTAQIVDQVANAKLLCYNMPDHGFYTYSGLLPLTKYYAGEYNEGSTYESAQRELISKRTVDFIITPKRLPPDLSKKGKYSLIKSMNSSLPDGQEYYLYVKNYYLGSLSY